MNVLLKKLTNQTLPVGLVKYTVQILLFGLLTANSVIAQTDALPVPDYESRRPKMVSQTVYKKMTLAQEALLSEKHEEALTYLQQILDKSKKLKVYDKAKIFEMLTSVSLAMNQYEDAVRYSHQAIDLKVLNRVSETQMFHRLIYMYFFLEDYENATAYFELWLALETKPAVKTYFAAAQIYAASDKMEQALDYALQGMAALKAAASTSEQDSSLEKPKLRENWIKLLIAIRLHLKKYAEVSHDLEQAISLWPQRPEYYQQLSAVYQELKREKEALVILSLAYQNTLINKETDINRLGRQYRYHSNPYKGAQILQQGLQLERIEPSEENLETVANAWLHAREWQRANSALQKAAKISDKGALWLQLCQTSTQDELWQAAKGYCQEAIKKGQLNEDEGTAQYLIALSEYYQGQLKEAAVSFDACTEWEKTKNTCQSWQIYATQALIAREEEALRVRENKAERLRRQQNQQQIVDKALLRKL